jgi:hypothetical protein
VSALGFERAMSDEPHATIFLTSQPAPPRGLLTWVYSIISLRLIRPS